MKSLNFPVCLLLILIQIPHIVSAQPVASFFPDRYNVCSETSVYFTNTSSGSNSYEWLIEGVHYSYTENISSTFHEGCYDLIEITLIATDTVSGLSDTASRSLEVFDTCFFHWTGSFLNCPGDTITLGVNTEEIASEFVISSPVTIVGGCITCSSISFVLLHPGTTVDRHSTYSGGCTEITTYEYFCITSGLASLEDKEIQIYPNPASERFTIVSGFEIQDELKIYDLNGRQVISQALSGHRATIDIARLASGVYAILILSESGKIHTRRLVVN